MRPHHGPVTPFELLVGGPRGVHPDRTRPFVTHYAGPSERVELSVASVANAVAKAAGMLRDGLGLEPGTSVLSVDLPLHWQLPVWTLAGLSVGARCGRRIPGPVDVRIVGPDALAALVAGADRGDDLLADDLLVSSCDAFGMPLPGGLPAELMRRLGPAVHDIAMEVRAYPDSFAAEPAAAGALLIVGGQDVAWEEASARSASDSPRGARLWVDEAVADADLLVAAALRPLWVGGSVVLATGLSPQDTRRIQQMEGLAPDSAG